MTAHAEKPKNHSAEDTVVALFHTFQDDPAPEPRAPLTEAEKAEAERCVCVVVEGGHPTLDGPLIFPTCTSVSPKSVTSSYVRVTTRNYLIT